MENYNLGFWLLFLINNAVLAFSIMMGVDIFRSLLSFALKDKSREIQESGVFAVNIATLITLTVFVSVEAILIFMIKGCINYIIAALSYLVG